jgi:hypothetical protein
VVSNLLVTGISLFGYRRSGTTPATFPYPSHLIFI